MSISRAKGIISPVYVVILHVGIRLLSVLVYKAVLTWTGILIKCIIYMGKVNVLMCVNFIIPSCLD